MSTTTERPDTYIPTDDEIKKPSGNRQVWRIAEGQIVTGRDADGSLEVREKVVGRLRRIGIFFGKTKDTAEPYGQLEADIETASGMTRVKTGITAKGTGALQPSVAALSFAEGLLDMAKDELMVVTANQSKKQNKFGKYSTYANLYHLSETKNIREAARQPKMGADVSVVDRWEAIAEKLATHPAFADRPTSDSDDEEGNATTHLSALCKECKEKGWPTPEEATADWMELMLKVFGKAGRTALTDYSDDDWGTVRQSLLGRKPEEIPGALKAAKARLEAAGATEKVDPFA